MPVTLVNRDIVALEAAMQTMLNPWDHASPEEWSCAVCTSVRTATGVDIVSTVIREGERCIAAADGTPTDGVRQYAANWLGRITGEKRRRARRLRSWVREDVWPAHEVVRSVYFNEFCAPAGALDSAGMSVGGGASERLVLYLGSRRMGRFVPGGREALMLRLLQPALAASTHALLFLTGVGGLVDLINTAVGLFTMDGRLVHANRAFADLLRHAEPSGAARRIAREVGSIGSKRHRSTAPGGPRATWLSADGNLRLEGVRWEPPGLPCGPLCVVSATQKRQPPDRAAIQHEWRLSPREADVALLLAHGTRNRDIALALSISEHTARRHTEHVLQKMGVTSRSQVAGSISGLHSHDGQRVIPSNRDQNPLPST